MTSTKLTQLRHYLSDHHLDGFIIQRGDEFLNEYVAPYAERLAWLTDFTGSAGITVVLKEKAAVFSDGRYILQMEQQLDPNLWEHHHVSKHLPIKWIEQQISNPIRLGYDPKLMSEQDLKPYKDHPQIHLIPTISNPIDELWIDQPEPPAHPVIPHNIEFSGQSHHEKIKNLQQELVAHKENAFLLCDPASICWLLNIRGSDVPYTPIPLVFALVTQDQVYLYADKKQYSQTLQTYLGDHIILHTQQDIKDDFKRLQNLTLGLDHLQTPIWFIELCKSNSITIHQRTNPCILPKSCKNKIEQEGSKKAHIRDAVAVCRFWYWLEHHGIDKTEVEVAQQLDQFRQQAGKDLYHEESFPAISAIGANGAVIHYHATPEDCAVIKKDQVYLIDSGGQYKDGTTDVTRTIWTGTEHAPDEIQDAATRVLKGHIAISSAQFPISTTGNKLDSLARLSLWEKGLDYDHGTGHGVGSYLSVHEGPCSISPRPSIIALQPGMIISNEPGYYKSGHYGIRLENLLLVQQANIDNFLRFEPLTMIPFDWKLIKLDLLTSKEKSWIQEYHQHIINIISPLLPSPEKEWLQGLCSHLT